MAFCPQCGAELEDAGPDGLCGMCLMGGAFATVVTMSPTRGVPVAPQQAIEYDSFGHYQIHRVLGEGGMGTVYLAEQTTPIHRMVALKVVKLGMDTSQVLSRFAYERQAVAMMDHPNIARVYDAAATEKGRPFFVMEYVDGTPITQYCDHHRLNTRERLRLFLPVCEAVQHAHQKGVIHRDLKPSNVLVTQVDGKPLAKVIDFGIAKAMEQGGGDNTLLTQLGQFVGTPEYMSPEQADVMTSAADATSDVYSLGVMLYELLVGAVPFDGPMLRQAGLAEMLRIIRQEEAPALPAKLTSMGGSATEIAQRRGTALASLRKEVAGDLNWIVMKAVEKSRDRRYPAVADLAADILRHLEDRPVLASPPGKLYRARKFVRRNKAGVLAAAAVCLAVLGGFAATAWEATVANRERAAAVRERAEAVRQRTMAEAHAQEAAAQRNRAEGQTAAARRQEQVAGQQAVEARTQRLLAEAEKARAQGRFNQLRTLANSLFDIEQGLRDLPGATATRKLLVTRALTYLNRLAGEAAGDPSLQQELAGAFEQIADVQGDPNGPNLGEWRAALANYQAALSIWEEQFRRSPADHRIHSRWWRVFLKTGVQLHDLGDLDAYRLHIRRGLDSVERFRSPADDRLAVDRADAQWLRGSALALDGNRAGALENWDAATGALETVVKQHPADQPLRDDFLVLLHATVLALGNRAYPASELRISGTVLQSLEEVTAASDSPQAAGDLALILAIRGRALVASGDSSQALACYRKALSGSAALLAHSPRNPLAGFALASVLIDFSTTFRLETVDEAVQQYRKYLDAARASSEADPVNTEARHVLYARLSDMAEMLDARGNPEAENFHQQAARVAGVLGTQLAQGGPVSTDWGSRQRFYHFRGSDNPADAAGLLGIRYSVMRLNGGAWEEVDPTREFHAGERLRLRVESNTDGYFYVASGLSSGGWHMVYPSVDQPNKAWARQAVIIPPGVTFVFDETPGTERLYVLFSKTPRPEWIASPPFKPIAIEGLVDLLRQQVAAPQYELVGNQTSVNAPASREHALYAVQTRPGADNPLIFNIVLKHVP